MVSVLTRVATLLDAWPYRLGEAMFRFHVFSDRRLHADDVNNRYTSQPPDGTECQGKEASNVGVKVTKA